MLSWMSSAYKDGLYFEQLSQFVCDSDKGHFGGSHVDFFSSAKQLVTLRALQELLGADLAKQFFWWTRTAVDLL